MAKEFLDELIEALEELKKSEAKRVYEAIENKEFPPLVMTPRTVLKTVNKVAMEHQITPEEMFLVCAPRSVTYDEFKLMQENARKEV